MSCDFARWYELFIAMPLPPHTGSAPAWPHWSAPLGHAQQLGGELRQAYVGDDGGEALDILTRVFRANMASGSSWLPPNALVQEGGVQAGGGEGGADLGAGRVCAVPQHLDGREECFLLSGTPWGRVASVASVAVAGGGG